jgi:hypothetical protein
MSENEQVVALIIRFRDMERHYNINFGTGLLGCEDGT